MNDEIRAISTKNAPAAIGPYSQAIRVNGFLFLSGQIPLEPESGVIVGKTILEQTERVIANIKGVLESQGLSLQDVVKTTVFLKNMNDFASFNEVYAKYFRTPAPARSTVEVARLPKDALVEIECLARIPAKDE